MSYPIEVTITLVINENGTMTVKDSLNKDFPKVTVEDIQSLYARLGGVRHVGELIYDDRAAAGACCLYQHLGCTWYCIKRCP